MFDGTGLRDKAFNATGKYETYKLALLIITALTINKTQQITMPQNLTQIIQNRQQIFGTLQRPNGGVATHYLEGFIPDPNATENIETTCLAIYACLSDNEIPLPLIPEISSLLIFIVLLMATIIILFKKLKAQHTR
jgi:hypothetical protein